MSYTMGSGPMTWSDLRRVAEGHGVTALLLGMSRGEAWNSWSTALHDAGYDITAQDLQWTWRTMTDAYQLREACASPNRVNTPTMTLQRALTGKSRF